MVNISHFFGNYRSHCESFQTCQFTGIYSCVHHWWVTARVSESIGRPSRMSYIGKYRKLFVRYMIGHDVQINLNPLFETCFSFWLLKAIWHWIKGKTHYLSQIILIFAIVHPKGIRKILSWYWGIRFFIHVIYTSVLLFSVTCVCMCSPKGV